MPKFSVIILPLTEISYCIKRDSMILFTGPNLHLSRRPQPLYVLLCHFGTLVLLCRLNQNIHFSNHVGAVVVYLSMVIPKLNSEHIILVKYSFLIFAWFSSFPRNTTLLLNCFIFRTATQFTCLGCRNGIVVINQSKKVVWLFSCLFIFAFFYQERFFLSV